MCFSVQRRTVGSHKSGNVRPDHLFPNLQFKCAEHRLVIEGAALHNDMVSQLIGRCTADYFIQRILDDGNRKTGTDVFNGCAVFLGLLDLRVHEYRAAGAKIDRFPAVKTHAGKLLHITAHRFRKRLQKAAAAGRTGLIEKNIGNRMVFDFETLHILTADIDDKIHIRHEMLCGCEMRNGLHKTEVAVKCMFDQFLTVSGRGHTGNFNIRIAFI